MCTFMWLWKKASAEQASWPVSWLMAVVQDEAHQSSQLLSQLSWDRARLSAGFAAGRADSRGTWTAITDPSECAAARSALSLRGDGSPGIVDSAAWRPYGCMVKTRGGGTDYVFLNLDGRAVGQASTSDANAICKLTATALQGTHYGPFGLWVARTLRPQVAYELLQNMPRAVLK